MCQNPPEYNLSSIIRLTGSEEFLNGDKITYECQKGYLPEYGTLLPTLTCGINGSWNAAEAPVCVESIFFNKIA